MTLTETSDFFVSSQRVDDNDNPFSVLIIIIIIIIIITIILLSNSAQSKHKIL